MIKEKKKLFDPKQLFTIWINDTVYKEVVPNCLVTLLFIAIPVGQSLC